MKRGFYLGALAALLMLVWPVNVIAQTSISADGAIESTSGGFIFPDGSAQASAAVAGSAPVEDTGQTECFGSVDCTGTGQDGEFQAGVAWPTPRFTRNGNGTATDNLTGLIWLKDADCPAAVNFWPDVLTWVAMLNTTAIACTDYAPMTFTDWRLPNVKELLSLIDYGASSPLLPTGHPFVNVQGAYWSSSSESPIFAWAVHLSNGETIIYNKGGSSFGVWPVRGGQ